MPTYEALCTTNADYELLYWQKIRALYAGAKRLRDVLHTPGALRDSVFPMHLGEEDYVYQERIKRACYIPHMSQLVDYLQSVLFSDPAQITAGGEGEDADPGSVEPFYEEFLNNTGSPRSPAVSFNQLLRLANADAMLLKRAWVLVDLPKKPLGDDGQPITPTNRYEEQAFGLDRAYCCQLDPEEVIDWEYDDEDQLLWVMLRTCERRRLSIESKRSKVEETFTLYDRQGWTRFVFEYDEKNPPKAKTQPTRIEKGSHSFGQVPIVSMELPEGLWAGGKLEGLAVELFNKRSALSWGQYRSLFQLLVAKLQNPDPMNAVSEDGHRATNQIVGPGRVWVGAEKDSLGFVGPDAAPFAEARADLKELRDEMHRVFYQMAQGYDNSASALKRSAESKSADMSTSRIICMELGRYLRDFAVRLLDLVAAGRGEEAKVWTVAGFDSFDEVSVTDFISEAVAVEDVAIPSPTFQTLYKFELAKRLLPSASKEQQAKMLGELKTGISAEEELAKRQKEALLEPPDEDDEEDEPFKKDKAEADE